MSKIKNGGLDQYDAGPFEQQQFGTAGVEWVIINRLSVITKHSDLCTYVQVYCEMGLNGGGYTFINPKYLTMLCNDDLQAMFSDKNSFLMRVRLTDFTQPYGLLEQLPQYQ